MLQRWGVDSIQGVCALESCAGPAAPTQGAHRQQGAHMTLTLSLTLNLNPDPGPDPNTCLRSVMHQGAHLTLTLTLNPN